MAVKVLFNKNICLDLLESRRFHLQKNLFLNVASGHEENLFCRNASFKCIFTNLSSL